MKVRSAQVAVLAVIAIGFAACGGSPGVSTAPTTGTQSTGESSPAASPGATAALTGEISLVMPESTSKDRAYWEDLIKVCEAENPGLTVDLQIIPWGDITQKVDTLIATQQQPDILGLNTWASYAADGLLNDMKDVVSPETFNDFDPNLMKAGQLDGIQYALPWVASVTTFAYNKDLFAQAGLSAPPTTWDELRAAAAAIKGKTGKTGYAIRMGPIGAAESLTVALFANGGDWTVDGKLQMNQPKAVEALTFLTDLAQKDKVTNPNPATADQEIYEIFARGDIGMLLGASFFPSIVDPINPNLNYDLVPIPVSEPGIEPASLVIQDSVMSFKTDNDPRLAGAFLDCYLKSDNLVRYQNMVGGLPGTFSAQQAISDANPKMAKFAEMMHTGKFYPDTNPAWPAVNTAMLDKLGLVVEGRAPIQETLDELQAIADQGQ